MLRIKISNAHLRVETWAKQGYSLGRLAKLTMRGRWRHLLVDNNEHSSWLKHKVLLLRINLTSLRSWPRFAKVATTLVENHYFLQLRDIKVVQNISQDYECINWCVSTQRCFFNEVGEYGGISQDNLIMPTYTCIIDVNEALVVHYDQVFLNQLLDYGPWLMHCFGFIQKRKIEVLKWIC